MTLLSHSSPQTPTSTARRAAIGLINLTLVFESIQRDSRKAHLGTLMVAGLVQFSDFSIQYSIDQPYRSLPCQMLSVPEAYNNSTFTRKLSIHSQATSPFLEIIHLIVIYGYYFSVQELNKEINFSLWAFYWWGNKTGPHTD